MNFKLTPFGIAAIGVVAFALPAWSHHSHANYSQNSRDAEGVITEVQGRNPHSWIYMSIKDASGKEEVWTLEGGGARGIQALAKEGKGLKPGDKVKVRFHPLRDGSAGGLLVVIKHPDGTVRDYDDASLPVVKIEDF